MKSSSKPRMTHKEIADKYCYPKNKKPCIYAENCEAEGNWENCKHAKRAK